MPLHRAAKAGNLEQVQSLLAQGADIEAKGAWGETPLFYAAEGDRQDVVKLLLARGANVNAREERYGYTVLHTAILCGYDDMVPILIGAGADVNTPTYDGETPLFSLVEERQFAAARRLLAAGADVNTANGSGRTTLSESLREADVDFIESLIVRGANVNAAFGPGGTTILQHAATTGRKKVVELLLAHGADINGQDGWGITALHQALLSGCRDIAELLLARGAKPPTQTRDGETLLHVAARQGYDNIVAALIAAGADIHAVDRPGDTPLLHAARGGHRDVVARLIAAGAAVNAANRHHETPLGEAVKCGDPNLVRLLIAHGADVRAKCAEQGGTALHTAAERGWKPVADVLIESGADINDKNSLGETPAMIATKENRRKIVRLLAARGAQMTVQLSAYLGDAGAIKRFLENGADVNALDGMGTTALQYAAREGHPDVVQLLLEKGADPDLAKNGSTPLFDAMWHNHGEVARILIEHGADVKRARAGYGRTPLSVATGDGDADMVRRLIAKGAATGGGGDEPLRGAAFAGHKDIVELLLAASVGVNSTKRGGPWTPLHAAALGGSLDIVRLLLDHHAAIDVEDTSGQTPAATAMEQGHSEIVKLLGARGATLTLHLAAYAGDVERVRRLIAAGADVNLRDKERRTPLYLAAQEGNKEVVELLLANGADANLDMGEDAWLPTPLHAAASRGQTDVMDVLLRHGADVNAKGLFAGTPLVDAARQGQRSAVETLIAAGAEVNTQDAYDRTPLSQAAFHGHVDVVELLLSRGADVTAGELKEQVVLPDPIPQAPADMARFLVQACAPYIIIVTDPQEVRRFLLYQEISFDDVWIPKRTDIQGLDGILRPYLQNTRIPQRNFPLDSKYVLRNFRQYNREFSGFIEDGRRYIICSMIQSEEIRTSPPNRFSIVADGGYSVVRVVFDAQTKKVTHIECNGN